MDSPDPRTPPEEGSAKAAEPETPAETEAGDEATGYVTLYSGEALDASEALTVTSASRVHVVVLGGPPDSGKTTLLASIYEELREGPFAGYRFAGSRTLMGFERICHLNSLVSGRAVAETERTKRAEGTAYYHLALQDVTGPKSGPHRHVLLSAISGELYQQACDTAEGCIALGFVKRADALAVLVDGAKLTEPSERGPAIAGAQGLLQGLLDAGMLGGRTRVELVVSKLDRIIAAGALAQEYADSATQSLLDMFAVRVPGIGRRSVAARPMVGDLRHAHGVGEAFRDWLSAPEQGRPARPWAQRPTEPSLREFAHYGWRHALSRGGVV